MQLLKRIVTYFSKAELFLWISSMAVILATFFIFSNDGYFSLIASLIGITSLIFCAKGNPVGQVMMIVFATFYGGISFGFAYYGEMITYIGMTLPMAVISLISWLKNPYKGNKAEVRVNRIKSKEVLFMLLLSAMVTIIFYYILKFTNIANLIPSTLSVTTSFIAAYLTFRRSAFFALAYALNDIVLIVMWILAAIEDISYLSVVICFSMFLINDLYGFYNWRRMEKKQNSQA